MIVWVEPKTDWSSADKFNIVDYNRIRNNISFVHNALSEINMHFNIQSMGEDMTDYSGFWAADVFNAIEENVAYINSHMENKNFGDTKTFFQNGAFITYDELNRIESATLDMKTAIDNIKKGIRHIPFRMGGYKAVRI